ncbi:alpha/beta fold hydrolase [Roseospira visakhapatnamensis]|uniref:Haloacetate dehalogenase n=1 Tax=Roseospira visakhapatnamensis TaxID=390880 RepID=A0A7W6WB34_9PROT|nr:alpha/beta hydrolase [Roseospira visakhapatnamensis]MBB4267423.1 haloacetate dehalogenase [Roseospira visakhapatnamensis]
MAVAFTDQTLTVGDSRLYISTGGEGPPLLLLHGFPQTHLAWRPVAERLADDFTVVLPDLPGYGRSTGPVPDAVHQAYSKRAMAETLLACMRALGHGRFFVAGHDRGGRVAYRLALDHPDRVPRLAVVDIVPTAEAWAAMTARKALATHHWMFLAQPAPLPERMIGANPDLYIGHLLDTWAGRPGALEPAARAAYIDQFRGPAVVAAACADYRAGATVDWDLDAADQAAGRRIRCPTAVIWGTGYLSNTVERSPAEIWRAWCAAPVTDTVIPCGHFVPEEAPDPCAAALRSFFLG